MANQVIKLELDDTQTLSATDKVAGIMGGLNKVLEELGIRLKGILAGSNVIRFLGDAASASKLFEKELLVMRLALGKLQVAWGQAFAPIAQLVLPLINDAIFAAIRMVRYVGKVIAGLFGFKTGSEDAAKAQDKLFDSTTRTSKAVKRTLASFDRLNRLNGDSGTGSSGGGGSAFTDWELSPQQLALVEWIHSLLAPLQAIDLQPLTASLRRLWEAMQPITRELFAGLEWAWFNIFVPIAQWTAEQLLPAFLDTFAVAVDTLGAVIEACKPAMHWVWENFLKPLAQWTGKAILSGLQWLRQRLNDVSAWMAENQVPVEDFLLVAGAIAAAIVVLNGVLGALQVPFLLVIGLVGLLVSKFVDLDGLWDTMPQSVKDAWAKIKGVLQVIWDWVKLHVLDPVVAGMKNAINGIISYLNACISAVVNSVNSVIRTLNQLSFKVPYWVPEHGGRVFGFNLKMAKATRIPYLAQGAVLPANKPFLAMVGDQHHGTNVEAPLTTIQEAVALVMEDVIASNLAGQEAVVGILRQILEAVLGIRIGDGDIARAVDRYRHSRAVINGTV